MKKREIERHPKVPRLNSSTIQLLTDLCFRPDDRVQKADLIFVFASPRFVNEVAEIIEKLLKKQISNKVLITGGKPSFEDSINMSRPESSYVLDAIHSNNFPEVKFYSESKSTNTLENVTEALKILDFSNFHKVLYIFKAHDSQRGYLSLKKYIKGTKLIQKTFVAKYPGTERELSSQTWHTYTFGIERVWGEFLRIKTYGERGDIAYDTHTQKLVEKIELSLQLLNAN